MKKLPPEVPIPFRTVHKQRIKLNTAGLGHIASKGEKVF